MDQAAWSQNTREADETFTHCLHVEGEEEEEREKNKEEEKEHKY